MSECHEFKTIKQISKNLGYDYDSLSEEQKEELENQVAKFYTNAYRKEPAKKEFLYFKRKDGTQIEVPMDGNEAIAMLNDCFRCGDNRLGRYQVTPKVEELTPDELQELIGLVQAYSQFTPNDDPRGRHDFGQVDYKGKLYSWRIDYYDSNSNEFLGVLPNTKNLADPNRTKRVLTLMHASEWVNN